MRIANQQGPALIGFGVKMAGLGVAAALLLGSPAAHADYFTATDWTSNGPGTTSVATTSNSVTLSYNYNPGYCGGCNGPTWQFSTFAPETGTVGFDWLQSANYAYFQTSGSLTVNDPTDGSITLNNDNGVFTDNGGSTLSVNAGDTITFTAYGDNFDYQGFVGGNITLSNLTGAVTASVPEPASIALFGAAMTGMGMIRRRRAV